MHTSAVWIRPDLHLPRPFDTIFFDVDGVLIKTANSFRATDIAVAEYIASILHGLEWGRATGKALVTLEDVNAFKQAGGYNNDWDMCYLLASFATARLREWQGTDLATRSVQEWAVLARAAHLAGHGGRTWVDETIPASARADYQLVGDLYHEYYWGADNIRKYFGYEPRYLPHEQGFVYNEEMLYTSDCMTRLRTAGITHLGMITGRVGPEVSDALERMETYSGESWWDVVVDANTHAKPDPQALRAAITTVGTRGGLYIGDTADDFDLVRRYRAERAPEEPDILAAMLTGEEEDAVYQQRGVDIIVRSVDDLVTWVSLSLS